MKESLPFKVGQGAESKSFKVGFRGAWFRCEIKKMSVKKGRMNYLMEYFDFPDEKVRWIQLYQKPLKDKISHLMVRPSFPPVYRENQVPDIHTISEVIAVVDGIWKVGDLVDWWYDDCYWSGQITHLIDEDKVKMKLSEPPLGEGGEPYDAFCKDLRPSLDWSPKHGWTVPISKASETCQHCVRLIQPINQDNRTTDLAEGVASFERSTDSICLPGSEGLLSPPNGALKQPSDIGSYKQEIEEPRGFVDMESGNGNILKPCSTSNAHAEDAEIEVPRGFVDIESGDGIINKSCSTNSCSNAHAKDASGEAAKTTGSRDRYNHDRSSKKMRFSGAEYFNSSSSDTIESSIMDLEELACRIKWLQRVHELGLESASAMTPSWKFLENRISSKHK